MRGASWPESNADISSAVTGPSGSERVLTVSSVLTVARSLLSCKCSLLLVICLHESSGSGTSWGAGGTETGSASATGDGTTPGLPSFDRASAPAMRH